ncbi:MULTISPECIES: succinate dehydrogenase, hydrophobic membrane anchor protein [unclassified Xanthobacter]|uniref:succinate dehydrogenase, hydrophobic membrane anchor protein n=1 Tax=unclassified Xanthobacter TaxID=2623496 RepID=UPI001EDD4881|nr:MULTISPECIES: succinate dehydrogenase, hydrophobic membrane anchor protein [unclassified Xanthobacter]
MSDSTHTPMRTPLGRVRGLGASRSGTEHFFLQRVTALANLLLMIAFICIVIRLAGAGYAEARAVLGQPLVAIIILLTLLSVCTHMRLGMQVVIEDYVHTEGLKVLLIIGNTFFTTAIALAGAFAVLKISLGG